MGPLELERHQEVDSFLAAVAKDLGSIESEKDLIEHYKAAFDTMKAIMKSRMVAISDTFHAMYERRKKEIRLLNISLNKR